MGVGVGWSAGKETGFPMRVLGEYHGVTIQCEHQMRMVKGQMVVSTAFMGEI